MKYWLLIIWGAWAATGLACSLPLNLTRIETDPADTFVIAASLPAQDLTATDITVQMKVGQLQPDSSPACQPERIVPALTSNVEPGVGKMKLISQ